MIAAGRKPEKNPEFLIGRKADIRKNHTAINADSRQYILLSW